MSSGRSRELRIEWRDLAIGLLPLAIAIAGSQYLDAFGRTRGAFEMVMVADAHLEAAGRIKMLATSFLLSVTALAALACFAWTFKRFIPASRWRFLGIYAALAALGLSLVWFKLGGNSELMMTRPVLCAPLELVDTREAGAKVRLRVWPGRKRSEAADPGFHERCGTTPTFLLLQKINDWHRYLLALILPAMVLGAISCLGKPVKAERSDADAVERLKLWLGLTAVMFVAGMLFMSALLRWPGFAFQGVSKDAYVAHVSAYVLFLGVLYTIFIAAFYLPIYARLSGLLGKRGGSGAGAASQAAGPVDPLDLGKIMLGVFAPAIAGLLGDILQL